MRKNYGIYKESKLRDYLKNAIQIKEFLTNEKELLLSLQYQVFSTSSNHVKFLEQCHVHQIGSAVEKYFR